LSISYHYSTFLSSVFSISFRYSNYFSSVFSKTFQFNFLFFGFSISFHY
jgi:hypothetical protein